MPADRDVPSLMALTPVSPGRAEEFETFVREVLLPAVQQSRPQAAGLVQLLRPATQAESSQVDGPSVSAAPQGSYVFVFFGDLSLSDWDLGPMFAQAHGEEEGARLAQQFEEFLDGDQVIYQFAGQV